jgi:hypothetical protein
LKTWLVEFSKEIRVSAENEAQALEVAQAENEDTAGEWRVKLDHYNSDNYNSEN